MKPHEGCDAAELGGIYEVRIGRTRIPVQLTRERDNFTFDGIIVNKAGARYDSVRRVGQAFYNLSGERLRLWPMEKLPSQRRADALHAQQIHAAKTGTTLAGLMLN